MLLFFIESLTADSKEDDTQSKYGEGNRTG